MGLTLFESVSSIGYKLPFWYSKDSKQSENPCCLVRVLLVFTPEDTFNYLLTIEHPLKTEQTVWMLVPLAGHRTWDDLPPEYSQKYRVS